MTPIGRALRLSAAVFLAGAFAPFLCAQESDAPRRSALEHYGLAVGFMQSGESAKADIELQVAIHQYDLDARFHWCLGQLRMEQKRFPEAAECFAKAAALDADEPGYAQELAAARLAAGEPDEEAIRARADAITTGTPDPESFRALARIYERCGNPDKALFFFEQAARIDPADVDSRTRAAALYVTHRGEYAKAREILEPAFRADPDNLADAELLVRVYFGLELDDRADDMREQVWGLAEKQGIAADQSCIIDGRALINGWWVTACAPIRWGKGAPVEYTFLLCEDPAKPLESGNEYGLRLLNGEYGLYRPEAPVERAKLAGFGPKPPPYRDVLEAFLKLAAKFGPSSEKAAEESGSNHGPAAEKPITPGRRRH